jgi:hypothetical protein
VRAKKQSFAKFCAHEGCAPPKPTLKIFLLHQGIASLFSYYETGRLRLFVFEIAFCLLVAIWEFYLLSFFRMSYIWQTSGEHSGSPPFAIDLI